MDDDHTNDGDTNEKAGEGRGAALAAGLILAALALAFVMAPRITAWADGVSPGLGFPVAVALFIAMGGGFIAVFWLRGRARR